jgi:2-polyprenyl-3-methyl-5-hydroxy-6-metoxy-1,4-benzoquinol methylase
VAGLEPSQWACAQARERFRLDCYPETLEQSTRFAPASFDVVAMIDVIEHLSDPAAAIRRAAELLRPGGVLYLVTPDIDSLSAKVLRSYPALSTRQMRSRWAVPPYAAQEAEVTGAERGTACSS